MSAFVIGSRLNVFPSARIETELLIRWILCAILKCSELQANIIGDLFLEIRHVGGERFILHAKNPANSRTLCRIL